MKEKIYAVSLYGGYMFLLKAPTLEAAKKEALADQGASNVQHVKLAHIDDINWVKGMGGAVPELDPVLPSEWAQKGYYVVEGYRPKPGMHCDYYDRDGIKRQGTIKSYDGEMIVIDGLRTITVEETFKVKHGR